MKIIKEDLVQRARDAMKMTYSPYSSFGVGAALLCKNGDIYLGTNVENASFGATCCAERVAFFSAIANGNKEFEAIAISATKIPCYPCGICRQVMSEFCDEKFKIYMDNGSGVIEKSLEDLLPCSFDF